MKRYCLIILLVVPFVLSFAQDKSDLKKHGISKRVEKVADYEDGLSKKRIVEERSFNEAGKLVEFKDWSKDGKIKEWIKYAYTEEGEIESETYLDAKERIIERIVYTYENGLKVKKSYFDNKERLVKEKFYEYSYF